MPVQGQQPTGDEDPPYANLKCPKCGEQKEFTEHARRATTQEFRVDGGTVKWDAFEDGDGIGPVEITCANCETTVWTAEPEAPEVTIEVRGGVATVTKCPKGVKVTVRDHDAERVGQITEALAHDLNPDMLAALKRANARNAAQEADTGPKDLRFRCECGNQTHFTALMRYEAWQAFDVAGQGSIWSDFDWSDANETWLEVECAKCGATLWTRTKRKK